MARIITKIGDVFFVKIDENSKKYFQYVANDLTQLNSSVIRAFKKVYPLNGNSELSEIVSGEVEFYTHCVLRLGIKLGFWVKIGNCPEIGEIDCYFRDSSDDGLKIGEENKVSYNWYVWKINGKSKFIGKLVGKYEKAEIGSVIPPDSIVYRMKTGEYDFVYPKYK